MTEKKVVFAGPSREETEAVLQGVEALFEEASEIYKEKYREWEEADKQRVHWARYEQNLVGQRNAMHSTLINLRTAINELKKAVEENSENAE